MNTDHQATTMLHVPRDLAAALTTPGEMTALLGRVLDTILQMPGADCGGVYLVDDATGGIVMVTHRGLSPQFAACVSHFAVDSPQARQARLGQPHYYRTADVEPPMNETLIQDGIQSAAIIPVAYQGQLMAVLCLASHLHDEIPTTARRSMEAVAALTGGMIARAKSEAALSTSEARARLIVDHALRESEHRFRLIADNVADVIWTSQFNVTEPERIAMSGNAAALADTILNRWRFSYVSPSVERMFGYTPDEAKDVPLPKLLTPSSLANIRDAFVARLSTDEPETGDGFRHRFIELEFLHKDGSLGWCEAVSTYVRDESGRLVGALGISRDITERRRSEAAIRESEAELRTLMENLPDFVMLFDRDATITFVNHGFAEIDAATLVGSNGFSFIVPEHRDSLRAIFDEVLTTGGLGEAEALDVFGHWWTYRIVPIMAEGVFQHIMAICTDVTERRASSEAVQKEQQLLRRLLDLHERDRQITAYDIHDGFVQHLAGALFRLHAFSETLSRDPPAAWEAHETACRLVSRAIDDARRLISGLRPPILDEAGIVDAIDYLVCESRQDTGLEIDFEHNVRFDRIAPPLETAIFRIVQESLRNACRHSGSKQVYIEMAQRDQAVYLEVRDWGIGFDPHRVAEHRFGLQGIRERVRLLGGQITIESACKQGTRICVELPIVMSTTEPPQEADELP